jgi:hypothetical protein
VIDLADLTSLAACRMYEGASAVWNGFAKNAHEGLAAPASVIPMSLLLLLGQVVPFFALLMGGCSSLAGRGFLVAWALGMVLRAALAFRFKQSWLGVFLHPVSVTALLVNQWYGAFRNVLGVPVGWRGRTVVKSVLLVALGMTSAFASSTVADVPRQRCPDMDLEDQNGNPLKIRFPRKKPCLLVIAGRRGTGAISGWVKPVQAAFGDSVEIIGLADVHSVPVPIRSAVRAMIRKESGWPILMDWSGKTVSVLFTKGLDTEVLVLKASGEVELRLEGSISEKREICMLECLRACGAVPLK